MTHTRFARALFMAFFALAGCDCGSPPETGCVTTTDCAFGFLCVDEACVPRRDGGPTDSGTDISTPPHDPDVGSDVGRDSSGDACVSFECEETESCFDGLDNDCDHSVDEGCSCTPGTTTRCLPGGTIPTADICAWGEMTCEAVVEFGAWGECTGAGSGSEGSLYGCRRIGIMGAPGANTSANFQAWLEMQGAIATRFHAASDAAELSREELETFDLVVVDWLQRVYTAEEAATLAGWVNDGGGLMVMTGHDSGATAERHVSLLAALGPNFDLAAGPINGPAMLLPHPSTMTADGADTLPPVTFNGGLRTTVPDDLAGSIVPMAVIGDQVVGVAGPLGMGHVLLFGDEWIEFDSEWSTMPAIPQFWLNMVTWLAPSMPAVPLCE